MQCSGKLGLSLELGFFTTGVKIATTDLAQHTLEQVRLTKCGNYSCEYNDTDIDWLLTCIGVVRCPMSAKNMANVVLL